MQKSIQFPKLKTSLRTSVILDNVILSHIFVSFHTVFLDKTSSK